MYCKNVISKLVFNIDFDTSSCFIVKFLYQLYLHPSYLNVFLEQNMLGLAFGSILVPTMFILFRFILSQVTFFNFNFL